MAADENGELNGLIALVTCSEGYGGDIQIAVGMDPNYVITGMSFLSINETAGLGMEAQNEEFWSQFVGKDVSGFNYTKTGAVNANEIDAISGATITTAAVTKAVNAARCIVKYFMQIGGI
ncbi:MAG: FMN-binding protein [Wujia sp.]